MLKFSKKASFQDEWAKRELSVFKKLSSPAKIQEYLDSLTYSDEPIYRSPRSVLRDRKAHCFDGALFAASAMRRLGYPPLIIELAAVRDDDHLLAIYRQGGFIGALGKSNFAGLRFREPIYRNLRELALSYFEGYYNVKGEKTLRRYSTVINLERFDKIRWMTSDEHLDQIEHALDRARHYSLMTRAAENKLHPMDERSFAAGLVGANKKALQGIAARYRKRVS
jgi:hypothetical protein